MKNLAQAAVYIDPAGQAVIGTTQQGQSIFNSAEQGGDRVLPLGSTFTEPPVIGDIDEKIGVAINILSCEVRENIFKANKDGGLDAAIRQGEWDGGIAGRKTSLNRCKPL